MIREIKGWHVLGTFVFAFSIIITVNLTLAVNAVKTFPGLEVKNSYVASQAFNESRADQLALGWDVSARIEGTELVLTILKDGAPVEPMIEEATFGRATHVYSDQVPIFFFDGTSFRAVVEVGEGNWNLRFKARAEDGTLFQQRVIVR